jgi:hypothetical protein
MVVLEYTCTIVRTRVPHVYCILVPPWYCNIAIYWNFLHEQRSPPRGTWLAGGLEVAEERVARASEERVASGRTRGMGKQKNAWHSQAEERVAWASGRTRGKGKRKNVRGRFGRSLGRGLGGQGTTQLASQVLACRP